VFRRAGFLSSDAVLFHIARQPRVFEWKLYENAEEVYQLAMQNIRYVFWQDSDAWLGYLEEFPDYMTQGESLPDLEEHLRDIYKDLTSGAIPSVRKVAELQIS